jgi:hypothetical protein
MEKEGDLSDSFSSNDRFLANEQESTAQAKTLILYIKNGSLMAPEVCV